MMQRKCGRQQDYRAHNPTASLNDIAKAAGIPKKKTTILSWLKRQDFQAFYNDDLWLLHHDTEQQVQRKREEEEKTLRRLSTVKGFAERPLSHVGVHRHSEVHPDGTQRFHDKRILRPQ
jgi:hypothetical protein